MEETKTLRLLKGGLRRREADEESCWFRDFFFFSLSEEEEEEEWEKEEEEEKKKIFQWSQSGAEQETGAERYRRSGFATGNASHVLHNDPLTWSPSEASFFFFSTGVDSVSSRCCNHLLLPLTPHPPTLSFYVFFLLLLPPLLAFVCFGLPHSLANRLLYLVPSFSGREFSILSRNRYWPAGWDYFSSSFFFLIRSLLLRICPCRYLGIPGFLAVH